MGAQAALGEHADSAHISKNRLNETPRPKEEERRSTVLDVQPKNGSSVMSAQLKTMVFLPYTKYGHGRERRGGE